MGSYFQIPLLLCYSPPPAREYKWCLGEQLLVPLTNSRRGRQQAWECRVTAEAPTKGSLPPAIAANSSNSLMEGCHMYMWVHVCMQWSACVQGWSRGRKWWWWWWFAAAGQCIGNACGLCAHTSVHTTGGSSLNSLLSYFYGSSRRLLLELPAAAWLPTLDPGPESNNSNWVPVLLNSIKELKNS